MGASQPAVDLGEFEALNAKASYRNPCGVGIGLEGLGEQEQAQAQAALARRDIKPGAIEKWFRRRGVKVSFTSVVNHRNKRCACYE